MNLFFEAVKILNCNGDYLEKKKCRRVVKKLRRAVKKLRRAQFCGDFDGELSQALASDGGSRRTQQVSIPACTPKLDVKCDAIAQCRTLPVLCTGSGIRSICELSDLNSAFLEVLAFLIGGFSGAIILPVIEAVATIICVPLMVDNCKKIETACQTLGGREGLVCGVPLCTTSSPTKAPMFTTGSPIPPGSPTPPTPQGGRCVAPWYVYRTECRCCTSGGDRECDEYCDSSSQRYTYIQCGIAPNYVSPSDSCLVSSCPLWPNPNPC
jgi:hypothetical protein